MQDVYDIQTKNQSNPDENTKTKWKKVWKMKGPLSSNWFLWQFRHNRLPTKEFLHKRRLTETRTCDICHQGPESALDATRDCRRVTRLWKSMLPPEDWHSFFHISDLTSWIDWNLSHPSKEMNSRRQWLFTFREGVRTAWRWRNNTIYLNQEAHLSICTLVQEIKRRVNDLEATIRNERNKEGIRWVCCG